VILLGPPASGKTTVANAVDPGNGVAIIRTGHLLRNAVLADPSLGPALKQHLETGDMAPTELVVQVIGAAVDRLTADVLVFDGFPRLENQIACCFRLIQERDLQLAGVLVLTLSDDEIQSRLAGRRACPKCGATYHVEAQPPARDNLCDRCDATLIQRTDDSPEAVRKRLDVYRQETLPVVEFFKRHHAPLTTEVSVEQSTKAACHALRDIVGRTRQAV
jgi:adenylate kinase